MADVDDMLSVLLPDPQFQQASDWVDSTVNWALSHGDLNWYQTFGSRRVEVSTATVSATKMDVGVAVTPA